MKNMKIYKDMSYTSKKCQILDPIDLSYNYKPIAITNMYEKSDGIYRDLPLGVALLTPDILSFADFVESALYTMTQLYPINDRIDVHIDKGVINKYELPFDSFTVSLYYGGWEVDCRKYTSNYSYTEIEHHRNLWVDLYYYPEDYDSDLVFKDILREINNFMNHDFEKYLKEEL